MTPGPYNFGVRQARKLLVADNVLVRKFTGSASFVLSSMPAFVFFFFQAEDGIRDHCVTGVQTCALPISIPPSPSTVKKRGPRLKNVEIATNNTMLVAWNLALLLQSTGYFVRTKSFPHFPLDRKSVV